MMSARAERALLLSVRPEFAERIFDGSKRVELRRRCPRIRPGDMVYIYVSSPVRALAGQFIVQRVLSLGVDDLWDVVRERAGVTQEEFEEYYKGAVLGYAIFIAESSRLPRPIGLATLRRIWGGFEPPQSFAYLGRDRLRMIET